MSSNKLVQSLICSAFLLVGLFTLAAGLSTDMKAETCRTSCCFHWFWGYQSTCSVTCPGPACTCSCSCSICLCDCADGGGGTCEGNDCEPLEPAIGF